MERSERPSRWGRTGERCGERRPRRSGRARRLVLLSALVIVPALPVRAPTAAAEPATGPGGAPAGPQSFASEPNRTWGTSPSDYPNDAGKDKAGRVYALAEVGTKVFLGGEFTGVTPPGVSTKAARSDPTPIVHRSYLVALDVNTGALLDWDAHPDGPVLSLAPSADGTHLYVGGMFRSIGGGRFSRLASVDVTTGAADPTFAPPIPDAYVKAMALSGDTLYVGGAFTRLGTDARSQLAAVDPRTGALRSDWIPPPNTGGRFVGNVGKQSNDGNPGNVADLKVTPDGTMVVVGGSFTHFAGRSGLIVLDGKTAKPTPWQPTLDRPRPVFGLDVWPTDGRTIFVAAGGFGGAIETFYPGRSTKPLWVHKTDGDGMDAVATDSRVFLVGHYDYVLGNNTTCGGTSCTGGNAGDNLNRHIAAFDTRTGAQDLSFNAQMNTAEGPEVALIGAHSLYVGGNFTKINFEAQPGFAQFPAADSARPAQPAAPSATPQGEDRCSVSASPPASRPVRGGSPLCSWPPGRAPD